MSGKVRQQRAALINDLTGFGRCSLTVQLPLISALKIVACPLPTAILSVHTGFERHFIDSYTDKMPKLVQSWQENDLEFDGILTGYLGSVAQVAVVEDFLQKFKGTHTVALVDPVMGDHGRLYSSFSPEFPSALKRLLAYADVVTPNLTEAVYLLGRKYPENEEVSHNELEDIAGSIAAEGPKKVVITGLKEGRHIKNFIYDKVRGSSFFLVERVGEDRSGTGDAFSAIVLAELLRGYSLEDAVIKAANFISTCLEFAVKLDLPTNYGIPFEEYLTELR